MGNAQKTARFAMEVYASHVNKGSLSKAMIVKNVTLPVWHVHLTTVIYVSYALKECILMRMEIASSVPPIVRGAPQLMIVLNWKRG